MWYTGGRSATPNGFTTQIGLATSSDGINWVKYDDPATTEPPFAASDPVLSAGVLGFDWDGGITAFASVLQTSSGYEMWYIGTKSGQNHWVGYATSVDGISWEKWPDNPIIGMSPPWDSQASYWGNGSVLNFDDQYHFWFTGYRGVPTVFIDSGHVGYATAPIIVSVEPNQPDDSGIPSEYLLLQNYPNPFNPATTIQYAVPHPAKVTLKVYNLMGQEVIALVENEQMGAGSHATGWDGRDAAGDVLASGVYFTRMQAGNFVQTRKMLLVQ